MPNTIPTEANLKAGAEAAQNSARNNAQNSAQNNIKAALHQAQLSCQAEQWSAVIAACKTAIAQSQQCLELAPATHPPKQQASTQQTAAILHQAKGDLFKSQGDLTAAIASYQQALALAPEANEVKTALGEAYLAKAAQLEQTGDVTAAVQNYLQAIAQSPYLFTAYSRLRYNLLRYNLPRKDPRLLEVIESCQRIVAKHLNIRPARITLGYALTKSGQLPEAIACYRSITGSPEEQRRPPDFIIIGAEKSGTTSLHQYLKLHPQVVAPIEKEIDFFDLEYGCGLEWYLSHFPSASATKTAQTNWITGETSANYLYDDAAPARIFEHFPQIKLVAILRDPVDRTVSRYNMMVRNGAEKRSLEAAIAEEISHIQKATDKDGDIQWNALNRCRHIGNSLYYHHLKRWLALFSRQQLLVLQSEDLFSQPQQTMQQLYQLIGLTEDCPQQKYPQHNAGKYKPADADVRQQLSDFFAPHNDKLETLLNQSFRWPSANPKTTPAPSSMP